MRKLLRKRRSGIQMDSQEGESSPSEEEINASEELCPNPEIHDAKLGRICLHTNRHKNEFTETKINEESDPKILDSDEDYMCPQNDEINKFSGAQIRELNNPEPDTNQPSIEPQNLGEENHQELSAVQDNFHDPPEHSDSEVT